MANRPKAFGLSGEIESKMAKKYQRPEECEVAAWITDMTGIPHPIVGDLSSPVQPNDMQEWLKDGVVLAAIMDRLGPGLGKKLHATATIKMEVMRKNKEMENISFFLTAIEKYGVKRSDLFQTVDLFEGRNMSQVLSTMYKVSAAAIKMGFDGPCIGVKTADSNIRHHTEEQLRQGRSTIGLQMGTNEVASQKGMTAYGLGRQVIQK